MAAGVAERVSVAVGGIRRPWWSRAGVAWAFAAVLLLSLAGQGVASLTDRPSRLAPRNAAETVRTVDGLRVHVHQWRLRAATPGWRDPHLTAAYPEVGGVPVYVEDGRSYAHPANGLLMALTDLTAWQTSRDPRLLNEAVTITRAVLATGTDKGGALLLPYPFDFDLYGDPHKVMRAPWFSALPQGLALSVLTWLHRATGDQSWLDQADAVYAGLLDVTQAHDGYLWLEEYPRGSHGERIFNGHVTALLGVYDYWRDTGHGRDVLDAAVTTAAHYATVIRQPGGPSLYSVTNRNLAGGAYPLIHVRQLGYLADVTGDPWFREAQQAFASDVS